MAIKKLHGLIEILPIDISYTCSLNIPIYDPKIDLKAEVRNVDQHICMPIHYLPLETRNFTLCCIYLT